MTEVHDSTTAGDDEEPEFRPRPRRRAHALTFVLGAALLVAAGFFGGVLLQKHEDHGNTSAASGRGTLASRFAGLNGGTGTGATGTTVAGGTAAGGGAGGGGGGRGFGGFGGGAGGGGAVTGTVELVDGSNVYVTDTSGNVVKIATGPSSQLTKTDPATTKDVAPGDVVIVRGTPNSDGSYTAQTLVISSASALGG
jgi:hypothetical protein